MEAATDPVEAEVQSIRRAGDLLDVLAERPELALGELSRAAGLHPATARRLLLTLEALGYVYQHPGTRAYRLGPKLMYLGRHAADQLPFRELVLEEMTALAREAGETVYIAILHGDDVLYVETAKSPQSVRLSTDAGDYAPAYSTATGRVLLGYLPEERLARYLGQEFEQETPFTVADPARLAEVIAEARRFGYSITVDEREVGVTGIAVPIIFQDGKPQAALAVAGPTYRISRERRDELLRLALHFADRINRKIHAPPDTRANILDVRHARWKEVQPT
jgi:IclR family pca regulon transcriptional regulator